MEDFSNELKELEQNIKKNNPPKNGVVMYGSSSFRLWGEGAKIALERNDIANLAFGGSTLEACAHYFQEIVVPYNPQSMIIYAGDNDLGNGKPAYEVYEFYQVLMRKIRKHYPTIPVTFVSAKPSPSRLSILPEIEKLNNLVESDLIHRNNHTHFINIFNSMMLGNGKVNEDLFIEDRLHMNEKGYEIWSAIFNKNKEVMFH